MVHASYKSSSDSYEVRMITVEDSIDSDMQSVTDAIQDTDPLRYRAYMVESVSQGLAYDVWKNGLRVGFVYNRVDGYDYLGASIHLTDTIGMLIALKTIFEIYDSHKISFTPHEDNLQYFKSMAYGPDIRIYHATGAPIVIRREDLVIKGLKLFKYFGVVAV